MENEPQLMELLCPYNVWVTIPVLISHNDIVLSLEQVYIMLEYGWKPTLLIESLWPLKVCLHFSLLELYNKIKKKRFFYILIFTCICNLNKKNKK